MYNLIKASIDNIELLIQYKLVTIFEYSSDIDEEEKKKILSYVNSSVSKLLDDYKIIVKESAIIGCVLTTIFRDGILLDEIYLEENYRNFGIGSNIIKNLLNKNAIMYLWVYKANEKAIKLYKKFNFKIEDETETRYLMKYNLK